MLIIRAGEGIDNRFQSDQFDVVLPSKDPLRDNLNVFVNSDLLPVSTHRVMK